MTTYQRVVKVKGSLIVFGKDKYFVCFIKCVNGLNTILSRKKLSLSQTTVSFKNRSYPINVGNIAYRIKNRFYAFIDIDKGQINFTPNENELNPEFIDLVVRQQIGKQIVSKLDANISFSLFSILLYIIIGVTMGYIIGNALPMP